MEGWTGACEYVGECFFLSLLAAFKDICPGGMGYHVTTPYIYKPKPPNGHSQTDGQGQSKPIFTHQAPVDPPVPFPTLQQPVEAFGITERQLPGELHTL